MKEVAIACALILTVSAPAARGQSPSGGSVPVTVDNFIRPILIRKGADLPLLLIFAGVIGGLIGFGVIGLFIGPVVLAVTYTLLKVWVSGGAQENAARSDTE